MDKNKNSKNYGKTMLVFERTIDTERVQEKIKEIRQKLNIPLNGFKFTGEIKYPEKNEFVYETHGNGFIVKSDFIKEFNKIKKFFPILNSHLETLLRNYIYYNKLLKKELNSSIDQTRNVCELIDAETEEEFLLINEDEDSFLNIYAHNESVREFLLGYPISIRIRHDTSINSLIEFIKINSKNIKNAQAKYVKNEQFSHKNSKAKINPLLKKRDDFIYKYKDIPRIDLLRMVNKKFNKTKELDSGALNKIRSRENKRRRK